MSKKKILILLISINFICFNLSTYDGICNIRNLRISLQTPTNPIYTSAMNTWNITFDANDINDIQIDSSNNFIIVEGDSTSDFCFLIYNNNGTFLGKYTWNSTGGTTRAHACTIDSQNNIIIVGTYEKKYDIHEDLFVVKFFQNGTVMWYTTWSNTHMSCDHGIDVVTDYSDNIYVVGNTY